MAQTLYDKLWDAHIVPSGIRRHLSLYIDRHLVHEVTSPQAFEGLAIAGRALAHRRQPGCRRSQRAHAEPRPGIDDPVSKLQVDTLANCDKYGITEFRMNDLRQASCT